MAYVLILDDDDDFAQAVALVLERAGHEVQMDLDPDSGLARLSRRRPDLLILDCMFPEHVAAGLDLARRIRQDYVFRDLPILMVTAVNQQNAAGFGLSAGAIDPDWQPMTDVLDKPVDLDVLCEKVSTLLEKANATARPGVGA